MITFQTERFADVIAEGRPLLDKHWEEVARNKDTIKLAPDYTTYARLDEQGKCLICTARDDGRLVGYSIYFIDHHVHYSRTPWAESDIYWIDPGFRRPTVALRLFRFAEGLLKERGVKVLHSRAKNAHPAAGRLLEHLGYEAIETVYSKALG